MARLDPFSGAGGIMVRIIELLLQHRELYWVAGAVALIVALTPIAALVVGALKLGGW